MSNKKDYTKPEPAELQRKLDEAMKKFLAKGGKIEKVPYGVTNQEMGSPNQNAGWIPPQTITPKTWRTRKTKAKAKKKKSKK